MSCAKPIGRLRLSTAVLLLLSAAPRLDATTITIVGDWSKSIGALDLAAGAGSDFISVQESDPGQGTVAIEDASGSWRVDVKKTDTVWDGALGLALRRTSDGSGSGNISGGSAYLEVGGFDSTLFSGDADRIDVEVQIQLSGLSADLGAASFSTTLTYTVVDE